MQINVIVYLVKAKIIVVRDNKKPAIKHFINIENSDELKSKIVT